jgi:glycyl-tRNA synthetase beta chain
MGCRGRLMPEFFLELFSEEIPARMQRDAGIQLERICNEVLRPLGIHSAAIFYGPRRIALQADLAAQSDAKFIEERGPRDTAPEAALAGFLGKHKASRDEVVTEGGYHWLRRRENPSPAADVIAAGLPAALAKFAWPKSMRWGQSENFTWVRPLRRIICLLDGQVIPIRLGPVTAGNETQGHRFMAPGAFAVTSAADWAEKLKQRYVIADQTERRQMVRVGISETARALGLNLVEDTGLIDEVTGLVEWPVPLVGRIDADFMDLPPEVRELSMKVNQRYFALRDGAGQPAPYFAFVANITAEDGGKAIVAGNERVLRARLSDARHFWDLDLKTPLDELLPKLAKITFHAKIGTQRERAEWIAETAQAIAGLLDAGNDLREQAKWAGLLSKADLVTGMVGEFPELQGVMGGYYAEKNPRGWDGALVGAAIKTHYQPRGPADQVPTGTIAVSVALADKLVTLIKFFEADEKPTGSGDPYALRRAALGVIRIILENQLRLPLRILAGSRDDLFEFIIERLRVKLRGEGKRFDVLDAVLAAGSHEDLVQIMQRVDSLSEMLGTADGKNLLSGYKRAANILRIEDPEQLISSGRLFDESYPQLEEKRLVDAIEGVSVALIDHQLLQQERYGEAMIKLASLRPAIDAFFENVTVNDPVADIRQRRLRLLGRFCWIVDLIADFSKIEG